MRSQDEPVNFSVSLPCRYLVRVPPRGSSLTGLAVTLHGYGSDPNPMLGFTSDLLGPHWAVAAVQGPFQHYANSPAAGDVSGTAGTQAPVAAYNWGIRDHWRDAVRLHHEMILHVLREARERLGLNASRCLLAGFSQPVGLNYRFCATHPHEARAVLAICGGVPRDWEDGMYQPVTASLLHIARSEDEFYPLTVAQDFERRLRLRAADVEYHLLPGRHRFPSQAHTVVRPWLGRVFGGDAAP